MFLVYLLAVVSTVGCLELQPAPNDGDSEEKCVCNPVVNVGSQLCNFDGQVADFQTVLIAQQAQITRLQNESKSSEIHLLNLLAEQKKITNNLKTRVTQLEERSKANCQVGNGASYRGTVSVTKTGKTCQRWDSQTPHEHIYTPDSYPSYEFEQNYCRNPSNHTGVWCYTMESNTRWETCDVPVCDLPAVIEAQNQKIMDLFKANDMKGIAKLYTKDCIVIPQGSDTTHGREGVVQAFSGARASGVRAVVLKTEEVGPMGSDVIYERGTTTLKKEDGSVEEDRYVVIWKKVGGEWLLYIDIFNSSKPEDPSSTITQQRET